MSYNKNIILLILVLGPSSISLMAQFRLPSMDVQVKSGFATVNEMRDKQSNSYIYSSPIIHGEINFNISQHFAAGAFISKGFSGQTEFMTGYISGTNSFNSSHQSYGVKLRISTGRQPRFRPFAELSYGKFEMYMEKDYYRISTSSTFFGGSVGLMIRLNNKLYLVVPQISFRPRSEQFFFEVANDFLLSPYPALVEITGGLSYNFGKKK